jgi:hypothetical protein
VGARSAAQRQAVIGNERRCRFRCDFWLLFSSKQERRYLFEEEEEIIRLPCCRGEGSVVGLQLRVRFVPAALLAV